MLLQLLKKFFIAAIFLSVAGYQVTYAANLDIPVDWNKAAKISSKSDLAEYLETKQRSGQNIIPVILTNGLTVSGEEFLQICPSSMVAQKIVYNDGINMRVIYETTDYPGTRVANAYRKGNTAGLNQEEVRLYQKAVEIVNAAKKQKTLLAREAYIYNEIARRTGYVVVKDFSNQPRACTAIGALLDGKANCQGYSDAFYMLGRMLNMEVGRMSGKIGDGAHMWNTITLENGKTYCVDVTGGDAKISYGEPVNKVFNSYIFFNAPVEIMQVTHSWSWDLAPKTIQGSIDENYAYCAYENLGRASNGEAALKLLAERIGKKNYNFASVMFPYDKRFSTNPANWGYFEREIKALHFNKKWWLHTQNFGKYIFVTACIYGD